MKIILASQSPRRRELLGQVGLTFEIVSPEVDEAQYGGLPPRELVQTLSRAKALDAARRVPAGSLVLGADTVVVLDGQALGKPDGPEGARAMLTALSGRTHEVWTGFTLCRDGEIHTEAVATEVTFRALAPEEIDRYVATGEPLDKAGAYGIQGRGALLVAQIRGDYSNVVGLPLCAVGQALRRFGVDPLGGL